jgi:hypothetical protein
MLDSGYLDGYLSNVSDAAATAFWLGIFCRLKMSSFLEGHAFRW